MTLWNRRRWRRIRGPKISLWDADTNRVAVMHDPWVESWPSWVKRMIRRLL
ncbi:hypothetical protein SEA_TYPHA_95 [Mycobacterium phage Typha]|uniref:Uncharacterized protein n=1 Tax=Mycobacterium phage Typha TaxID=2517971 RepID=A0A482J6Q6_9CAUD|nr:hypothetical protein KCH40_gp074 [Mycobacterium phage Typha]QBP29750.1 hypothetical protein SEA_TYPHA_95 [Mycobacterium phage Typha]